MASHHYLHTGQRTCHADDGHEVPCEGSGQDASFAVGTPWPGPRFDVRDNAVMDGLTGLIWCRNANLAEFPLTWQEALDFVATMNREQRFGQHDWRMPNRRELRSLLSLQTRLPALPEHHPFIDVFNGWYWTATTAAISPAHAWYVALDGARMFYGGKDQSFMLWPVRGEGLNVIPRTGQSRCYDAAGKVIACVGTGQDGEWRYGAPWPEPRFEMMQAGVLDRLTRLLWRRSANLTPQPVGWREALAAVPSLTTKTREVPGGCQQSTNWNHWWIAPRTVQPCRSGILSPTCRTFTGRLAPACSNPIGPGRCTWKKARRASDKSGLRNFPYGPWQRPIEW